MIREEEWKELGDLSKSIRSDLFKLLNLSNRVKMRKKEIESISRAIKHLDVYKSRAEDFMFSHGVTDLNIFYGDSE